MIFDALSFSGQRQYVLDVGVGYQLFLPLAQK
jgi:hypothetical protein